VYCIIRHCKMQVRGFGGGGLWKYTEYWSLQCIGICSFSLNFKTNVPLICTNMENSSLPSLTRTFFFNSTENISPDFLTRRRKEVPVWRQVSLIGKKNSIVALCLKCLKFEYFWIWLCTHRQSCEVQKQACSAVVLHLSYSNEPLLSKQNGKRKQFFSQPPS
jgi:hypothetical protein